MTPVPTFRELAEKATKGPWKCGDYALGSIYAPNPESAVGQSLIMSARHRNLRSNALFAARCDPDTMLKVYEALVIAARFGPSGYKARAALRLLDGATDEGET